MCIPKLDLPYYCAACVRLSHMADVEMNFVVYYSNTLEHISERSDFLSQLLLSN